MAYDISGRRFGRWRVIGRAATGRCMWDCVCDCEVERAVMSSNLTAGNSISCGCVRTEITVERSTKHGQTKRQAKTPEHRCWVLMRGRTTRSRGRDAARYKDRGIRVCARWLRSFEAFFGDMGIRPSEKHSIDRINNDGHYSCGKCDECVANGWPANCRWATPSQQASNRSISRLIEFSGRRLSLATWARELGLSPSSLAERISKWPLERAMTEARHK